MEQPIVENAQLVENVLQRYSDRIWVLEWQVRALIATVNSLEQKLAPDSPPGDQNTLTP